MKQDNGNTSVTTGKRREFIPSHQHWQGRRITPADLHSCCLSYFSRSITFLAYFFSILSDFPSLVSAAAFYTPFSSFDWEFLALARPAMDKMNYSRWEEGRIIDFSRYAGFEGWIIGKESCWALAIEGKGNYDLALILTDFSRGCNYILAAKVVSEANFFFSLLRPIIIFSHAYLMLDISPLYPISLHLFRTWKHWLGCMHNKVIPTFTNFTTQFSRIIVDEWKSLEL
jgi:hypothetical protein